MEKRGTVSVFIAGILTLLVLLFEISPDVKLIGVFVIYAALFVFVSMTEKGGR